MATDASRPLHVMILGGGTAGWMAANLMVKKWPPERVKITLVESPDIGIIGVGEGSTPSLKGFFDIIDIAESTWMPRCHATYKLNIRFAGWSPESGVASYCHPFISQLDTFTQRPFIVNCLTRRLGLDVNTRPEDFFINGVLAGQGKGPLTPEHFPFRMEYGYHFDAGLLGEFLADVARERGVDYRRENIVQVLRHDSGDIRALKTAAGESMAADFFIDCSGFASVLMQKALGVAFDSFRDNLFNDSAVVMPTPLADELPVETRAVALSAGWCWQIPLTSRFGNGYVYSADFTSPEQAEMELRRFLGCEDSPQACRHLTMRVGQLRSHWHHNCLGLGLAQGFIEPLEATALHLVQLTVELFISKFEEGGFAATHREEFNGKIRDRFDRVRDYIVAHYKLNTRTDSEYWRANRDNKQLSQSLLDILDVWYRRGDLSAEIARQKLASHFGTLSWHCLLAGYGAFPPLANKQPGRGDRYQEARVGEFLRGCSINYQSQRENLAALAR